MTDAKTRGPKVSQNIMELRKKHFVLWRPGKINPIPTVYIAKVNFENNTDISSFEKVAEVELLQSENFNDLWLIPAEAKDLKLEDNTVYHYWFKIANANPYEKNNNILYCTDPFTTVVDERVQARNISCPTVNQTHYSPAGVLLYKNGELKAADPEKAEDTSKTEPNMDGFRVGDVKNNLYPNHKTVIYELPPRWSWEDDKNKVCTADGNFRQVEKMINRDDTGTYIEENLSNVIPKRKKYLPFLGINALELTPPANSEQEYNWGYGTADYFAPDFNLSTRDTKNLTRPATDLVNLVKACHKEGIRFFYDAVMAFSVNNPYRNINYLDFFIQWGAGDPEQGNRNGFGGDLVKYNYYVNGYNPNDWDSDSKFSPSREYLKVHLKEWIENKGVSGLRLDSINNINCSYFLDEVNNETRKVYTDKKIVNGSDDKYLVVGEELSVPAYILEQGRLDGLWNEMFKNIVRNVLIGKNHEGDNFEQSVQKMIDCRLLGRNFSDIHQAINYLTSHDVGGDFNRRICTYLWDKGVTDVEKRIELGFACLMTALGIPMILAGDEFADKQDLPNDDENKQRDPVNYLRLKEDWRKRIFYQIRRLIRARINLKALSINHTKFLHCDFDYGKRIMIWQRGIKEDKDIVITVANFSDWGTENPENGEYIINNWPLFDGKKLPEGKKWLEITKNRKIAESQIGRESIYPWEAKVYALVDEKFSLF